MNITLTMLMSVPAQTHATHKLLQFLHLWDMTTSVTQEVQITFSTSSMETILSGMDRAVGSSALAAPGTVLPGS